MSRLHEALEKARRQQSGGVPELPDVEEIIATGVSSPERATVADAAPDTGPVEMFEANADSGSILAHCTKQDWSLNVNNLIFLSDETNAVSQELFRTLRSRLYQLRGTNSLEVIVVCSAVPGEGKTFVSANLAHAFAQQSDRRALVIDADIRRAGGLSTLLGAPSTPGLTDYLLGEQSAENIIQTGPLENLYFIPCGKRVATPGELIGNSKFVALIEQLRPAFDWIIIDTPPVLPISDARAIADLSDGVLMVVNARSTPAHLAKRGVREFRRDSLLGVALNRMADPPSAYYAGYGYGQGEESVEAVKVC